MPADAAETARAERDRARDRQVAHALARVQDIVPAGLDGAQRARLIDVLTQVWDTGCDYDDTPLDRETLVVSEALDAKINAWHGEHEGEPLTLTPAEVCELRGCALGGE